MQHRGNLGPARVPNLTFASPVAMQQAPNDASRWFVVEQGGRVRAFENDPAARRPKTFIDLSARRQWTASRDCSAWRFILSSQPTVVSISITANWTGGPIARVIAEFTSQRRRADARSGIGARAADGREQPQSTTMAATSRSVRTGSCTSGSATAAAAATRTARQDTARRCSARCCASTWTCARAVRPMPYRAAPTAIRFARTPLCNVDRQRRSRIARRSTRLASAIHGVGVSIAPAGELWVGDVGQDSWEESRPCRARRQLRLALPRRRALLRARAAAARPRA